MSKNIRAVPAILTEDTAELETLVRQTESFTDYVQMDVMDGRFVPSRSVTCADIAAVKPNLRWEAHLMVEKPEDCAEDFKAAGAELIIFHYEATPSPADVIASIRKLGVRVGLAVNPETTLEQIEPLVNSVDNVLFLSVNPGYYGAAFIPEVLDKITAFRKAHPEMEISIDGGVKEANIAEIARTGVDVICIGSAVFRQPDPGAAYRKLLALAQANSTR